VNLPNLISLARLLSVPLTVWLILESQYLAAFWIFIAAGVSDGVDGFIAKRFDARTVLGSYLDPLADKVLLVSVYIALGYKGDLPSWLVILVVSRDFMIIGGSLLLLVLTDSFAVEPLIVSKVNTLVQILLAGLVLAALGYLMNDMGMSTVLIYVATATTLASGAAYLATWWRRIITSIEDDA